ncbi:MAG: hypothetical protein ACOCXM_01160 [Myxococcota bacterium]
MRIQAIDRLASYFQERLRSVLERRSLRLGGAVQVYLIDLLERYSHTHPQQAMRPLVEHLSDALDAPNPQDRLRRYRQMGDAALCVCGLFHEHLSARGINRRYVVSMGGHAYRHAAHLAAAGPGAVGHDAGVYGELADRFDPIVSVLDDIRETTASRTPQDVLRLYERWQRTRSPVLAERLREAGVYPQGGWTGLLH